MLDAIIKEKFGFVHNRLYDRLKNKLENVPLLLSLGKSM